MKKKKNNEPNPGKFSIASVRDRLNNVKDLIDVCGAALLSNVRLGQERTQMNVAHVLYFYVEKEIITAEAELSKL